MMVIILFCDVQVGAYIANPVSAVCFKCCIMRVLKQRERERERVILGAFPTALYPIPNFLEEASKDLILN